MPDQYATIAQFSARYDIRRLGDLVNDDGTRTENLTDNAILNAILQDATAIIKAAAQAKGAYSDAQMAELFAAADSLLIRLTCDVAIALVYRRRAKTMPDAVEGAYAEATEMLDALRNGSAVFGLAGAKAAGVQSPYRPTDTQSKANWPLANSPLFPPFYRGGAP